MSDMLVYKDVFKLLPGPYIICSSKCIILAATDSALQSIGVSREDFIGKCLYDIIPTDIIKDHMQNAMDKGIKDSVVELPFFSVRIILHLSPAGETLHVIQRWVSKI